MSTSTDSAPPSAATDITAGLERVQDAIDRNRGSMIPSEDVADTGPLGPPALVLQPADLLAPNPTTRREIADVIADVARRTLALGGELDALAREIGNNAAQVLAAIDPIERLIAAARAVLPRGASTVHFFEDGSAAIQFTAFSAAAAEALSADLGCNLQQPRGADDHWLRAERGTWLDPVRLLIMWEREVETEQAPAAPERAA